MKIYILAFLCLTILGCEKPDMRKYVLAHHYVSEYYTGFLSTNDIRLAAQHQAELNPQYDSLYVTRLPADTLTYSVTHPTVLIFHFCSPKKDNNPHIEIEYDSLRLKDYLLGAY